jgi:hypothetical protein
MHSLEDKMLMRLRFILLAGVLVAFVGCSKPSSGPASTTKGSSTPAANVDATQILTQADAEAILGEKVEVDAKPGNPFESHCNYYTAKMSGLGLLIKRSGDANTAQYVFQQAQSASKEISKADPQPVSGLGEQAYWAGGQLNQLNVREGNDWLIFTAFALDDKALDYTKQAATKALARLP